MLKRVSKYRGIKRDRWGLKVKKKKKKIINTSYFVLSRFKYKYSINLESKVDEKPVARKYRLFDERNG